MTNYIANMRSDLGISRAEFSRRYNIPVRTLEAWESGDREAPEYVIDLLGRAVYADMMDKKPIFYVIEMQVNKTWGNPEEEWTHGRYDSYIKAIKEAQEISENSANVIEIRLYVEDVENEDCENFDCNLVTF